MCKYPLKYYTCANEFEFIDANDFEFIDAMNDVVIIFS